MRNRLISLLIAVFALLQSDLSEARARMPRWNRVAPSGGHQNDPQLVRATGGPVVPIFEGWFPNPNGSCQLCFGYVNTNAETIFEIPVGPNSYIEPEEFNGL